MARLILQFCLRPLLGLMVATSLLTSGFAHNSVPTPAQVEKATYLLSMGLTAAELCNLPGEDGQDMAMGGCPVCHLAGAMLLPTPDNRVVRVQTPSVTVSLLPGKDSVFSGFCNLATPARAPPLA